MTDTASTPVEYVRVVEKRSINELNDSILIEADEPNEQNGNASHHYKLSIESLEDAGRESTVKEMYIDFQDGPIKEVGYNGFTNESLIEVALDRLRAFQTSKFACRETALAITALEEALNWSLQRTAKRLQQGVEGTHELHK